MKTAAALECVNAIGKKGRWHIRCDSGRIRSITQCSVDETSNCWALAGFVDCHCHILPTGLDLTKLNLSCFTTHEEVLDAIRQEDARLPEGRWLEAVHYNQNRLPDARHLTLRELDEVSLSRPIILRHSSGHASVSNSAMFIACGITRQTEDPEGGSFVRDQNGAFTGLALERAHEQLIARTPLPTLSEHVQAVISASQLMNTHGITSATDMMTGFRDLKTELEAYRLASEDGCNIRLRMFVQYSQVFGPRGIGSENLRMLTEKMDPEKCRVEGIKIFADGAIGSATAAIYGKYRTTNESGRLIYKPERLMEMVKTADEAGYRIAIHAIGDRAVDAVMDAFEQTLDPTKHRIEHAMILSDSQIERMAKIGCMCVMQPGFLSNFSAAYAKQLGPEFASRLKRVRSLMNAGVRVAFSSDAPIAPIDPWQQIERACVRPEGYAADESITRSEAIRAYTETAAMANGDEQLTGILEEGKAADIQLVDQDPLKGEKPTVVSCIAV